MGKTGKHGYFLLARTLINGSVVYMEEVIIMHGNLIQYNPKNIFSSSLLVLSVLFILITSFVNLSFGADDQSNTPLYSGYPNEFDSTGYIDAIYPGRIVIDDSSFILHPTSRFYTPGGQSSIAALTENQEVGIKILSGKTIESLWLISNKLKSRTTVSRSVPQPAKPQKKSKTSSTSSQQLENKGIYFENGVWKSK